jgi:uncharacterized protein YidB (DUF937 family)
MDFAVHAEFTNAAGDELGVLRAEIEDQNPIGVDVCVVGGGRHIPFYAGAARWDNRAPPGGRRLWQRSRAGGPLGGLGALLGGGALSGGLKDLPNKAKSWVAAGDNEPIEASELAKALGDERIDWLAEQTGMSREELLAKLSSELPSAVNELTPE